MSTAADKYTVSGAGDSSYNGQYNYYGQVNGRQAYSYGTGASTRYLYCAYGTWYLGPDTNADYQTYCYTSQSPYLGGNPWYTNYGVGTDPAPSVAYCGSRVWRASGAGISAVNQSYEYYDEYELYGGYMSFYISRWRSEDHSYYLGVMSYTGEYFTDLYWEICDTSGNVLYHSATNYGSDLPDNNWSVAVDAGDAPTVVSDQSGGYMVSDAGVSGLNDDYVSDGMGGYYGQYNYLGYMSQINGKWTIWTYGMMGPIYYYATDGQDPDSDDWYVVDTPPAPTLSEVAGHSASGTILDGSSQGVSGVLVTATASGEPNATDTTDANGEYTVENLADATWTLTPTKSGWYFDPHTQQAVISEADVTDKDFTGYQTHTISGTLVDGSSDPVVGADVAFSASSQATVHATTDEEGDYASPGLEDATWTVTPIKKNWTFSPIDDEVVVSGADVIGEDFTGTYMAPTAFPEGWQYYCEITVDHTKVGSGGVTEFPVLITETDLPSGFWTHVNSDGSDVRVTNGDGSTLLKSELVSVDTTGEKLELWFKAPSLSSSADSVFRLYYGYEAAEFPTDQEQVWSNDYVMVAHLSQSFGDSSASDHTITAAGNAALTSAQKIFGEKSCVLDGAVNTELTVPASSDFDFGSGEFGIGFWFRPNTDDAHHALFAFETDYHLGCAWNFSAAYNISIFASSTGTNWDQIIGDPGGNGIGAANTVPLNTWARILLVRSGSHWQTYINGVKDKDLNLSFTLTSSSSEFIRIGAWGAAGDRMWAHGNLQHYVIAKGIGWTQVWATTEYNNQSSPSTFYSVGSEHLAGHSISGTVLDSSSNPVSGLPMKATATGYDDVTTATDENGDYTLAGLADATWRVERGD